MEDKFDEDYYERGLETGKSCYQNYRWIPELTIPMAASLIDYLDIKRGQTVLDYGCAKGYLVKAWRWLGREAWGMDISSYAIENSGIKEYCLLKRGYLFLSLDTPIPKFDFCIAKDVFEHIQESNLSHILKIIPCDTLFVIVPLGKEGEYYAFSNNLDDTHIICEDEVWWRMFFDKNGWEQIRFAFDVPGIKESYKGCNKAHGFFTLRRKENNDICCSNCKL